jgi:hypothetical protein
LTNASPGLLEAYRQARQRVVDAGYQNDLDWHLTRSLDAVTESSLFCAAAIAIINSGSRGSGVDRVWPAFTKAFRDWDPRAVVENEDECRAYALAAFRSTRKVTAVIAVARRIVDEGLDEILRRLRNEGIPYLQTFPMLGPVTSLHMAKNIGMPVAKPDRHLNRLAMATGMPTAQDLCTAIADDTTDTIPVVDYVLWRYATLDRDYLDLFRGAAGR